MIRHNQWKYAFSNFRSLRKKCVRLISGFMNNINIDILALQESHLFNISDVNRVIIENQQINFVFKHSTAASRGVGIIYRKNQFERATPLVLEPEEIEEFELP